MLPTSKDMLKTNLPIYRFYAVLFLSVGYFGVQLIVAHMTHSLILQIDSYHMLYNIFSLLTCIVTIKLCRQESSLKNTFGWTRIDVFGATMFHSEHHHQMESSSALIVGITGGVGLVVQALTYFIIGGYSFQVGSFLGQADNVDGNDVIISASVQARMRKGIKRQKRQGLLETFRDTFGTILVVIVACVVGLVDRSKTTLIDYVDPSMTLISIAILGVLSYRYAKEAGRILLLTIPDHINVRSLMIELEKSFPEIEGIHDFHVWQLTPARIFASAHIVLNHTEGYLAVQNNIIDFLHSKGISQVTLQPEFLQLTPGSSVQGNSPVVQRRRCFLPCSKDCEEKQCCTTTMTPCNSVRPIEDFHVHHNTLIRTNSGGSDSAEEIIEPERQPMI